MKKFKLFFALFAMLALNVGNAWAETKTEGFEQATTSTNYQGTVTVNTEQSDCGIGWTIYYGCVSTSSKISGNNSAALRLYTSNNYGYLKTTTPIDGLSNVTFKAKAANSNSAKIKVNISYSKDGSTWTNIKSDETYTTTYESKSYDIPSGGKYFQIAISSNSTNPTKSSAQLTIDDVVFTYETSEPGSTETAVSMPTFSVPEGTFYSPINVELSCETAGAEIHYTLDGSTPSSTSETYTSAIAISETTTVKAIAVKDGLTDSEVATATYTKGETVTSYDIDFETNALEAYVNWDFSNITITTATIQAKGGTYYGNTSGKASAYIKTKEKIQYPGILTFSVSKESDNTTASNWLVQVSENGTTWSTVGTISATKMTKGNWNDHSVDLSDYENVYVQISYSGSTAKRAIDEISLAQGVAPVTYTLTIEKPENGTLSVTKGGVLVASGEKFKATTSLVVTPTPNAGYVFESLTVNGTTVVLTEGSYNLTMPAADVTVAATFKANEKPDATLTLSKNGETEDITGYKQDDKVTLPFITSDCVKKFVGWSANANCTTEPEYKAGEEYTLASETQTLYAVYANENNAAKEEVYTFTKFTQANTVTIEAPKSFTITLLKGNASTAPQWNSGSSQARVYAQGSLVISADAPISKIVYTYVVNASNKDVKPTIDGVSGSDNAGNWDASTKTWIGNDKKVTFSTSGTAGNVGFTKVAVTVGAITYSNYSTTCVPALANPTFSLEEGKYTEAKSVTISAAEGTIYYTLDGAEPTTSSTQYTGAIALNDCGEYTIKAIAISNDSQSDVVSATYTIKLPLTNSEAAPYTEAEAIAVYVGGCYDNQDVYVKGTVKTATFNNSGTYTITLADGFQFYKFYKTAGQELFTDGAINAGDVLVACGKLSKYNTTYQLAEGCYLVVHEPYTEPKVDISNDEATAYSVDKAFELIGDVSSDLTKEVYVKGLVAVAPTSIPTTEGQMTYSISDNGETAGNVLKVYLGLGINGAKFTSKNDVQLGDYVVVKGQLLNYNGTYELNKGNQLVQHKKVATITIADITMEVEEVKTISAIVEPAKAEVTYTIKENADNAISLSGNTITALAVGTAIITATVENGATYMGNSVDFTVTVGPKTEKTDVVILAELDGKWYAMKGAEGSGTGQLAALEVTYFNGTLYKVPEDVQSSITWTRSVVDGKATFVNKDNSKYLKGTSAKTDLVLDDSKCEWTFNGTTYTIGSRTFLYRENFNFKNYTTDKADASDTQGNYSSLPVVTAAKFETAIEIGSGDNSTVIDENVVGQTVNVIVDRAFEAGDEWYTLCVPFNMPASVIGTAYQLSGLIQKDAAYVEVNLAPKNTIEAGQPYLVKPNVTVNKFLVENVTIVNTTGKSLEQSISGLSVTMQGVINGDDVSTTDGLYWVGNSGYLYNDDVVKLGLRTYFNITTTTPSGIAPRMRVVAGENVETGVEDLFTTDAPVKVIENGQLIIIRDGVKYNVQGQKL